MGHYWFAYAHPDIAQWGWGVDQECWIVGGGSGPSLSWLLIL